MASLDSKLRHHSREGCVTQDSMSENIQVTLPDGSKRDVPKGATPLDVARSISPRLADAALVAKIKPSALSSQHSAQKQTGSPSAQSQAGEKTPASMHAHQPKDGWQFVDLNKPLDEDA